MYRGNVDVAGIETTTKRGKPRLWYPSNELAHVWVHQSAPEGKCASNMSFEGNRFSSYWTVIGERLEFKGKPFFLLSSNGWSSTTSQHQSHLRGAIPDDATVFYGPSYSRGQSHVLGWSQGPESYGTLLCEHYETKSKDDENKASTARGNKPWLLESAAGWLVKYQQANEFFEAGLPCVQERIDDLLAESIRVREVREAKEQWERDNPTLVQQRRLKAREARYRLAEEKRVRDGEAARIRNAENIEKWLAGERVYWHWSDRVPTMLRVSPSDENIVETSRGARVPLEDVKRAYHFLCLHRSGRWHRNGEQFSVGNYQLDAINEAGLIAGCHRISWDEIERFAAVLGLIVPKSDIAQ